MTVISYYQHSQGGKGKYIEKKISSVMETCSMNIKISELPMWLEYPKLHRKKGIFTQTGLSSKDKSILRNIEWDWLGKEDEITDVGNLLLDERTLVLVELKNRVDSGGTAGRREIWTKKFKTILSYLSNGAKLYRKEKDEYSIPQLLSAFNIGKLELYIGILFNVEGTPATKEGDREKGFYSSNVEGYIDLRNFAESNLNIQIKSEDSDNLRLDLELIEENIQIEIGAIYGNEILNALFRQDYSVSDLLFLRFDDIWLSQLLSIDERAFLLKYDKNCMTIFMDLLKRDRDLRAKYDRLINSECEKSRLDEIVECLFDKYGDLFEDRLISSGKDEDEYLGDVIQVLCASEA